MFQTTPLLVRPVPAIQKGRWVSDMNILGTCPSVGRHEVHMVHRILQVLQVMYTSIQAGHVLMPVHFEWCDISPEPRIRDPKFKIT